MFSRRAVKFANWAALIAVLGTVLLPVTGYGAGKQGMPPGLHDLCTAAGLKSLPDVPPAPGAAVQAPCVFCISSVPVFADAHAPRVVAINAAAPLVLDARSQNAVLPRDTAALQPLSARAPPSQA